MMHSEEALAIVASNIGYAGAKRDAANRLLVGQMQEIALIMADATEDRDDLDQKRRIWADGMRVLGQMADCVELAIRYHDALQQKKPKGQLRAPLQAAYSVSYLRNRGSDGAYDHFTRGTENARALYVTSHEEALDNCYDEYADACILPYSDPERGVHMGFRMLIARYGFKINEMVRVENREGTAMDYVLLRRDVQDSPEQAHLAITLSVSDGIALTEVLSAAGRCGLLCNDICKLPEAFADQKSYDLHFHGKKQAIDRYLFYLSLNCPRHELLGIYRKERETI